MTRMTRGRFLGLSAGAGAGLATGCGPDGPRVAFAADGGTAPDLIVHGGTIHTMDDANPRAESVAVKDGRFVAVGSRSDVENLRGAGTQVIDHGDGVIVPGFVDAHTHPAGAGVRELKDVNVDVRSVAEIKDRMATRARETPVGQWVVGFKYDDTKLAEGRPLNRRDLDEAVPDHPAVVGHRGGHTSVYNSRAFALAGVDADTPDPDGGKFYRAEGALTGLVAERANYVFRSLIPSTHTDDDRQAGVALITKLMAQAGLTSFHDAGTSAASLRAYRAAYEAGELRCRVYMLMRGPYEDLRRAGVATGFGDEWLRVGPVKYGADGSASERTMRMSTPYVGRPDDYGILTMSQAELHEAVEQAHRSGWQVGVHANGDVAIDMVLNAYERVQERWPRPDPRHRIEHCSLVDPDLLRRIKAAGVVHLRPLSRQQVGGVRSREDGVDVRPPVVPGPRNPRGAGVGLHSRSLRAPHGRPEHGDPHRLRRSRVGREPADQRGRSAAHLHDGRRVRVVRGARQGVDCRGQAGGLRGAGLRSPRRRSRHRQGDPRPAHRSRRSNHARGMT